MIKTICARMEEFRKIIDNRFEFSPLLPPLPKELREAVDEAIKKELKKMADQIHSITSDLSTIVSGRGRSLLVAMGR